MNLSCNHEEADTRLFVHVHVHHAIKDSAIKTLVVLSNDVDIVVIAVAVFADLQQDGLQKLWVAFGQSNKRRWMPIHTLFAKLGKEKSEHFCSSTHSVVVIMFPGLKEKARRCCSKRGLIFQMQHRLL